MNIPVTLNVKSANAIPVISCMQGDTPILVCTIMNGTEKFVVNKAEFDLCVCEGETAKHKAVTINASISGNTVSVKMTKNETDEAGDIKLCIRFSNTKNNNVISTFPFILKATQNPSYTAVGQMDDVSALTDYVAEAKKYAKEAEDIVGSNFITQAEKGVAGGVAVLNDNLAVAKAVADEDGNNIQETYAKKTEIGEIIEVDSELSATSTNPVQNKIVTAAINSASQQAGIANGKLEQWQAQGRIPNGIANNLVTTEEGYVADARQLNKSVAGSFADSVDKSISALNNALTPFTFTNVASGTQNVIAFYNSITKMMFVSFNYNIARVNEPTSLVILNDNAHTIDTDKYRFPVSAWDGTTGNIVLSYGYVSGQNICIYAPPCNEFNAYAAFFYHCK